MANARPILLFYTAYQKVLSKGLFQDLARSFSSWCHVQLKSSQWNQRG